MHDLPVRPAIGDKSQTKLINEMSQKFLSVFVHDLDISPSEYTDDRWTVRP
jgi:hypothetical protein